MQNKAEIFKFFLQWSSHLISKIENHLQHGLLFEIPSKITGNGGKK